MLATSVGLQRVPLPDSLLLDDVELRGNNIFGSSRRRDDASMAYSAVRLVRPTSSSRNGSHTQKRRTLNKNGKVELAHEVRRRYGIDIFTSNFEDGTVDAEVDRFLIFRVVLREW